MAACVLVATLVAPGNVSAATYLCPDGFVPVPVISVPPEEQKKDRNRDFVVCAKVADSKVVVGPDAKVVDNVLL